MENGQIAVVTGGSGFVGSHLVDLLLEKGFKVRCIVRGTSNLRWLKDKDVIIDDCGLHDKTALSNVLKNADYLFHVAGVVRSKTKKGFFLGNVETTKNLLEVIAENGFKFKRIVIVSSLTACGPSPDGKPIDETVIPRPVSYTHLTLPTTPYV
jgi:nucleoside-diphosphate-sugar epimerase